MMRITDGCVQKHTAMQNMQCLIWERNNHSAISLVDSDTKLRLRSHVDSRKNPLPLTAAVLPVPLHLTADNHGRRGIVAMKTGKK